MRWQTATLSKFAEARAKERLKKLSANVRRASKQPDDADAIHDLRVSIRRFKQSLRVFEELFDPRARRLKRKLQKLMDSCGAVRNYDVAIEVLKAACTPASGTITRRMEEGRSEAIRDLEQTLAAWNPDRREKQWSVRLQGAEADSNQSVESHARKALLPLAEKFFRAGGDAAGRGRSPAEIHPFRLLAKRFRYTLEIYGPAAGSDWERGIEEMRRLQDRLGAINDCVVTAKLIAEMSLSGEELNRPQTALRHLLAQRVDEFREHWHKHFDSKRQNWWLGWLKEREAGSKASIQRRRAK